MVNRIVMSRTIPILVFVLLFSGLVLSFSSVQASDRGSLERSITNWTSNGYQEVKVSLQTNAGDGDPTSPAQLPTMLNSGCVLNQTSMISHWPLDDGPGSTTFKDVFGVNDGNCVGETCPKAAVGKVGGAFQFTNSESDSIEVPSSTDFDWSNTDSFSVGLWVKTSQDCDGNKVYVGRYRDSIPNGTWWVGCADDGTNTGVGVAVFRVRDSDLNPRQANGTSQINDGEWHYIVGVRDGSSDKNHLFVDGVLETTLDAPAFSGHIGSDKRITMGSYDQPQDYYLNGSLDEVVIYDRALPGSEINTYYDACKSLNPGIYLPLVIR